MFSADVVTFREFMMREPLPLATRSVGWFFFRAAGGRDRDTARATVGEGLAVSAFPLYVPV